MCCQNLSTRCVNCGIHFWSKEPVSGERNFYRTAKGFVLAGSRGGLELEIPENALGKLRLNIDYRYRPI